MTCTCTKNWSLLIVINLTSKRKHDENRHPKTDILRPSNRRDWCTCSRQKSGAYFCWVFLSWSLCRSRSRLLANLSPVWCIYLLTSSAGSCHCCLRCDVCRPCRQSVTSSFQWHRSTSLRKRHWNCQQLAVDSSPTAVASLPMWRERRHTFEEKRVTSCIRFDVRMLVHEYPMYEINTR